MKTSFSPIHRSKSRKKKGGSFFLQHKIGEGKFGELLPLRLAVFPRCDPVVNPEAVAEAEFFCFADLDDCFEIESGEHPAVVTNMKGRGVLRV